ncbi:MAG: thioredoxin domain-containing protein [Propionibacteriaceae bacterium]|jgi:hypothetical protein|nr:thioredoxin domain-containing protein [Propionibacteriaceae bacterium]
MSRQHRPAQTSRQVKAEQTRRRRRRTGAGWGLIVGAIALACLVYQLLGFIKPDFSHPPHASAGDLGIYVNQVSQPSHEVVIYSDYSCVGCVDPMIEFYESVTLDASGVGVQVEIRDINGPEGDPAAQAIARRSAIAAACADSTLDYGFFMRLLYYHQYELNSQNLREIVNIISASDAAVSAYQTCYDTDATAAFVDQVDQAARASGRQIVDWPVFLLDGQDITAQIRTETGQLDEDAARALVGLPEQ